MIDILEAHPRVLKAALRRCQAEAEGGDGWWMCFRRTNGEIVEHAAGPMVSAPQRMFAHDMIGAANRHLHYDGAWLIVFTHPEPAPKDRAVQVEHHPYRRFVIMWLDRDGDIQFPIENDDPFWRALSSGPDWWMEQLVTAHATWKAAIAPLELRRAETFKKAQGQVAPSIAAPATVH